MQFIPFNVCFFNLRRFVAALYVGKADRTHVSLFIEYPQHTLYVRVCRLKTDTFTEPKVNEYDLNVCTVIAYHTYTG
jgi:hypothetical protein